MDVIEQEKGVLQDCEKNLSILGRAARLLDSFQVLFEPQLHLGSVERFDAKRFSLKKNGYILTGSICSDVLFMTVFSESDIKAVEINCGGNIWSREPRILVGEVNGFSPITGRRRVTWELNPTGHYIEKLLTEMHSPTQ